MPLRRSLLLLALGLGLLSLARAQTDRDFPSLSVPAQPTPGLGPVQIDRLDALGTAMAQDHQGFLWFAGQGGLYRYDGYGYTHFRHDPQDATSLAATWVESLCVDREGTLWVGTFGGGLARFDAATETFTPYRRDPGNPHSLSQDTVTVILEDRGGTLWVGTHGGLDRFDRKTGTFTHFRHDPTDPASLSNDQVRALYEDHQGTLWVGTGSPSPSETPVGEGGLNRFDPATGTFTRYLHDPRDETSLIHNQVMSLYEDSRGVFYVGTLGDGLHTMDRKAGTFTRHRYDPNDPSKLSRPFVEGTAEVEEGCAGFGCGGVTFIHEDRQGVLWVGGMYGGVNRYDVETGAMSHHEAAAGGLVDNTIWRILEAHDGTLWIGTFGGAHKVVSSVNAFQHVRQDLTNPNSLGGSHVTAFHEDPEGRLWIGLVFAGLDRLDRFTGVFTHFRHDPDDPTSVGWDGTNTVSGDGNGGLWAGHDVGISHYDRSTGRFTYVRPGSVDARSLSSSFVRGILEDRQGRVWVGTWGRGLDRYDPATGTVTHHRHDPGEPGSLSDDVVWVVYEDQAGGLWAGTSNGLSLLVERPGATGFEHYLSGHLILSLYEDRKGRFWVGTMGDGLHRFDRETGESTRYGPEEGLPSSNVMGLLEDEEGYLWISTAEGDQTNPIHGRLSRLDPEAGTFTNFDRQDGLPDVGFSPGSALKSRDGTLYFGGTGGFTVFHPAVIRAPISRPPKMALTGLRVFNAEVVPGPGAPLTQPIHLAEEIQLPYAQNDFTIEYTALAFHDPGRLQYHYRLEPHDAEWISARAQRSARYSGLSPGTYVFRVRVMDGRGQASVEDASIRVVILPPWWRTWWAYAVYGLLFVGGVFAVDRVQRRRLLRTEREKTSQREKELRADAAEAWANYLQAENQRQTQELEAARALQLSMLPRAMPSHPDLDVAAHMQTATEVGGDYYDFRVEEDGTLTFAIGDATGHGTTAGTMVTAMKSLWNAFSADPDLEAVMCKTNAALRRLGLPKLYMAFALGRVRGDVLELVGAGMPPALIYREASGCIDAVPLKGAPLGSPGGFVYRSIRVPLAPGDTVLLMSDGFPELREVSGEMLGYERMPGVFAEAAGGSADDVVAHLKQMVGRVCAGQPPNDDVTFVVLKWSGVAETSADIRRVSEPDGVPAAPHREAAMRGV